MDDESGESMEPIDDVPPKEPGETESGASRGIPDDTGCVFRISRVLPVNRVLKTNSFHECALKIALTGSTFQPKMHKYRSAAGLRPDPLAELTALTHIP